MATGDKDSLARQAYYAEGDTASSIIGIPAFAEGSANTLQALQLDASKHLQVDIAADSVGIGGGTQYTEDVATPAAIVGNGMMMERDDQIAAVTPVEGDWVGARATEKGALWVAMADPSGDPVTSFGGTQYQEDAAHSSGNSGTLALVVRQDTAAQIAGTDGDYTALITDANGRLHTLDANSAAIKTAVEIIDDAVAAEGAALGSGILLQGDDGTDRTNVLVDAAGHLQVDVLSGASGGTAYTEDVASANPIVGTATMMERDDALGGLTPAEGDWASLRCDANGALWTHDDTLDAALSGSELQVDIVAALPAGANAIGKLAANSGVDIGDVDVTSITGVTMSNAGMQITGDEAHDAADAGNPVKVGGKAKNQDGSAPGTAAAEDDRVDFIADVYGRQFVETSHPNYWSASVDYAGAQTNATVKAAAGAGLKLYITDIYCSNGAVAGNITLLDGSGGTVMWETYPAINGGGIANFKTPVALTANTLLAITSTTVTTHSLTVSGFIAP